MKRKYYDIVFAHASIRMFLENIAVYYQQQDGLTECDRKKVDKIVEFLIEHDDYISDNYVYNFADGQNLVALCRKCGDNDSRAYYLKMNKYFDQSCFDALLKGFEEKNSENFEASDSLGMEALLISCKYMPEERLRKFAESEKIYTRAAVAKNPSCPIELLESLARDKSRTVRISVARNNSTPEHLLMELAGDDSVYVRRAVACNRSASADVIRKLISVVDYETYRFCVYNPKCSSDVLETLAKYTNKDTNKTYHVRMKIAIHPNATKEVYEALKSDENPVFSQIALANSNCPLDELYKFNPNLKYAKSIAYYIMKREDLTDEIVKIFLNDMGARIRAVVIHMRELMQEDLLMYYKSNSKDVVSELAKKLRNNEALMDIMRKYGNDIDSDISRDASASLGTGAAEAFIEYIKEEPDKWEYNLKSYIACSSCTEDEMWQAFDEFCGVRENEKYPLAEKLLDSISHRSDMSEKSIERFIEYVSGGRGIRNISNTMHLVASFDNFYSKSLLNMCMSYIKEVESESK